MYVYGVSCLNIVGFKVDNRFIHEFNDQEFDLSDIEVCLDKSSEANVYNDKKKGLLVRENKYFQLISYC